MSSAARPLWFVEGAAACLAAVLGAACVGGNPDSLRVEGAVELELEGGVTGFDFGAGVRLAEEAAEAAGSMRGHCALEVSGGEVRRVELGVARPGVDGAADRGLSAFDVAVGGADELAVTALLGDTAYRGTGGPACAAELLYADPGAAITGVRVACDLEGGEGRRALASAELHFEGCRVR